MTWRSYPRIEQPSPVLALADSPHGLWAGGVGGIARYSNGSWERQTPLFATAALAWTGEALLAGGAGGILRWKDSDWRRTTIHGEVGAVTALAVSPDNQTMLAGTLNAGILRSEDGGREWHPVTFGLASLGVTALLWVTPTIVVAATADGLYRSPNAGRAWQLCAGTEGGPFAALCLLPDASVLAAVEVGGLLRSTDAGQTWAHHGNLPPDIRIITLAAVDERIFVGSLLDGLMYSTDGFQTWSQTADEIILSLLSDSNINWWAGTLVGLLHSTDGQTWAFVPPPPLYDLHRLLLVKGAPLVYGSQSTPVMLHEGEWVALKGIPRTLTTLAYSPDGAVLASSLIGIARSLDGNDPWLIIYIGEKSHVAHISIQANGIGYAGRADGLGLLRTRDFGITWQELPSPFGVLPLAALQGVERGGVIAVTYDTRRNVAQIWRSADEGSTWQRGAEIQTAWPVVTTLDNPLLIGVGGYIFVQHAEGGWQSYRVGDQVRRIAGDSRVLYALCSAGVLHSHDGGEHWSPVDLPPHIVVSDIAYSDGILYLLTRDGVVWYQ